MHISYGKKLPPSIRWPRPHNAKKWDWLFNFNNNLQIKGGGLICTRVRNVYRCLNSWHLGPEIESGDFYGYWLLLLLSQGSRGLSDIFSKNERGWLKKFHLSLRDFQMLFTPGRSRWTLGIFHLPVRTFTDLLLPVKKIIFMTSPYLGSLQPCTVVRTDHWGDVRRTLIAANQDTLLLLRSLDTENSVAEKNRMQSCDNKDIAGSRRKRRYLGHEWEKL